MTRFEYLDEKATLSIASNEHLGSYVGLDDYRVAVFLGIFDPGTDAWFGNLAVEEEFRGQGIGEKLVKEYEEKLIADLCEGVCGVFTPEEGCYDKLYNFYVNKLGYKFFSITHSDLNKMSGLPEDLKRNNYGSFILYIEDLNNIK